MTTSHTGDGMEIKLSGDWTIDSAGRIDGEIAALNPGTGSTCVIDAGQIARMDTAGAWLAEKLYRRYAENGADTIFRNLQPKHDILLKRLQALAGDPAPEPERFSALSIIAGRSAPKSYFAGILCPRQLGRYRTADDPDIAG